MTIEELRNNWDWTNTKKDMIDRVTRAIISGLNELESCNFPLTPTSIICYCSIWDEVPLSMCNFSIRRSLGDVDESESILATPKK